MIQILIAFFWFTASVFIHIILVKVVPLKGFSRFMLLTIFILGFMGAWATAIPLMSIALYCSLSLAYAALTASPSLGDVSPTTTILIKLYRDGPQTEKELMKSIRYGDTAGKRIDDLLASGWIRKKDHVVIPTKLGSRIAIFFLAFRGILGLSEGG